MNTLKIVLFATVIVATAARAQITLTSDRNPVAGDRIIRMLVDTAGVQEGPAGAHQVWDFSGVALTGDSTVVTYVHPLNTPAAASFPNATVATEYVENGDSAYTYYVGSATHFALLGMSTLDLNIVYSNAEVLMTYPFSYDSEFSDISSASYGIDEDISVERRGGIHVKADGNGTLILPDGQTMSALRVKVTQTYTDTTLYTGFPIFITTTQVTSYQWYTASSKFPVFGISYMEVNSNGNITRNKTVAMVSPSGAVNVDDPGISLPSTFTLEQNFPNPFNPTTTIRYALGKSERVTLEVYTLIGRKVATLVGNEIRSAGAHEVTFTSAGLPSGVYVYSLKAGDQTQTRKLTVLK